MQNENLFFSRPLSPREPSPVPPLLGAGGTGCCVETPKSRQHPTFLFALWLTKFLTRRATGRRWSERKPRAVQAQATSRNRCHSAPTGLQETSTTNGLCTGTMQGLWKLQHPGRLCRPTNHLVKWKRMRPL